MEFVIENYIWFAIGGVVLLMALIGFIAEKTNFGQKPKKEKKEEVKEEPAVAPVVEEIVPTEPVMEKEEVVVPSMDELMNNEEPMPVTEEVVESAPVIEEQPEEIAEPVLEEVTAIVEEPIIEVSEKDFEPAIEPVVIEDEPDLPAIEEVVEEEATDESNLWKF
jgi:hypothetical protein